MPFTLAHPAAVLPLRRTGLVFSALVIGSLAPDSPYFLYITNEINWGHTTRGVFLFCLPIGLALFFVYQLLVKRPLVALAPEFIRKRLSEHDLRFDLGSWRRFLLVVVSLLIGTVTHVLWDGFTHDHGLFVEHWQILSTPVETYRVMPLWRALQQGCSVAGVGLVALVTAWWWFRTPPVAEPVASDMTPRLRWFVLGIMTVIAVMGGFAAGLAHLHGNQWKLALIQGVIAMVSTAGVEIMLFSLAWQLTRRADKREKPLDHEVERLKVTSEH